MTEIRIHGRGGQGAVVASKILALSFFIEGYEVQSFPAFGVERRGAPVCAFARIDKEPIRLRSEIYKPDHIIVLDYNLIDTVDVTEGLNPQGSALINAPREDIDTNKINANRIGCVDAAEIAIKHRLGSATSPIINTAIIGAFAGLTGLLKIESISEAILQETPIKKEANVEAAKEAFKRIEIIKNGSV